jgi:hypothetical protein
MGKLALLAGSLPPRDPARADLAREIEKRDAIARDVDALREAAEESKLAIWSLRAAHTKAEAAIKAAKEAAAGAVVDRALGRTGEAVPPLDTARRLLTDAADALEVAQAGEAQRVARLEEEERRLVLANIRVDAAASRVIAESDGVKRLAGEVARLQREMLNATLALEWLTRRSAVHVNDGLDPVARDAVVQASFRMRSPPNTWNGLLHRSNIQGAAPWESALAALCKDADAVLPA